jgi:hypothetical protein
MNADAQGRILISEFRFLNCGNIATAGQNRSKSAAGNQK